MQLLTYAQQGKTTWGARLGQQGVVDLARRLPNYPSLLTMLDGGANAMAAARAALAQAGNHADAQLAELELLPPILAPRKILCIGVNYADRNAEYKDGSEAPKYPSLFIRTPGSLVGHGQALLRPPESEQLDYEGEITLVIGQGGRRIPRENALEHIAGLTCMNEGTLRDWVRHAKFNVTQGKNFGASGSVGPWITTADEYPNGYGNLQVQTRVNGELRQDDNTQRLMFDFAYLISYLSTFMTLEPGDLIATGTPTGSGARFDPPRYLKPGDVVEVDVEGVGALRNRVEQERV